MLYIFKAISINHESKEEDEPDLLGDIRFTRPQYFELMKKGIFVPEGFVDSDPALLRTVKNTFSRGADALADLWKNDWDENEKKYLLPWYFDSGYPDGWRPYVRNRKKYTFKL